MSRKVAIVTDWLTVCGGAEEVIKRLIRLFPEADVFTTVYLDEISIKLGHQGIPESTLLQRLPAILRKRHPLLLPFLPRAVESLDVSRYNLILSSSSFVGKAVLTDPKQLHICYCHSPTRYLWGDWQQYLADFPLPKVLKMFLPRYFSKLRIWDVFAAERPDLFVANSEFIREAILKYYRREATVIHPPVDTKRFQRGLKEKKSDFYLALGRLVPQKRFDLLIEAFKKMPKRKLKIAGIGRNENHLKDLAKGAKNIEFVGFIEDAKIPALLGQAKALLFPQLEDAGITAIEALAAGTPVIAFGKGGAKDMLKDGVTGVFFHEQAPQSVIKAIEEYQFRAEAFDRKALSKYAEKFSIERFDRELLEFVENAWEKHKKKT